MRILVVMLLVSVALAGCGDKEGSEDYTTPEKVDGLYVITISSSIDPENAKVPEGSIVQWDIVGTGCHILAEDGSFDSKRPQGGGTTYNNGIVPAGDSYRWAADAEGTHDYRCSGRQVSGSLRVG